MPDLINKKTIAKNTIMLYLRMGVMMLVSLYTSRIILVTLGVDDFGIYNVVGGVVVLFSFMNLTLTTSIRRFLAYELGKGMPNNIQSVFNSSVIAVFITGLIILIALETIGLWILNNQLNIPEGRMEAANFAFQFSILSFFLSINAVPYSSAIVVYEKMGVYAYFGIIEVISKLLLVFLLQYMQGDKLKWYCLFSFGLSFLLVLFNFLYCELRIIKTTSLFPFKWNDVLAIFRFSFWTVFGTLILMIATQGVNMIFNIFFGVAINAAFGIAQQVTNAINQFIGNFQTAFHPQLVKNYSSEGLSEKTFGFVCQTSRMTILLIIVLVIPIIANISPILSLWLKIVPNFAESFTVIFILYLAVDGSSGPLYLLVYAKGDVKIYQIVLSTIQVVYILSVLILCELGCQPNIVLSQMVLLAFLLYIARIVLLKRIMKFPVKRFLKDVIAPLKMPIIAFIILVIAANYIFDEGSIICKLISLVFSFVFVVFVMYKLYLNDKEKKFIYSTIKNKLCNYD